MLLNSKNHKSLVQNFNWIILALFFFILGTIAALVFTDNLILIQFIEENIGIIEEMAQRVFEGPAVSGILILFFNNLLASIQVMLMGFLLGIPSLLGLFANGALLGHVLATLGEQGEAWTFLLLGILPHGIFELPAFFISGAFGLKLGFHLLFPLPQKSRKESIGQIWREYWNLFPLIVILLVIGAVVEVLLTPLLLSLVQA